MINIGRKLANSPELLAMVFAPSLLTSSFSYMLLEDTSFLDSVYWSIVTATTLGYGDFSPHSVGGKVLTSVLIMFTLFVILPTITANVSAWLIVNRDAFTHDEQEQIKSDLSEVLALLKTEGVNSRL